MKKHSKKMKRYHFVCKIDEKHKQKVKKKWREKWEVRVFYKRDKTGGEDKMNGQPLSISKHSYYYV